MKRKKKRSALTLIEIIIALSIMGMILSLLWQALFGIQKKGLQQQKKAAACLEKMMFYTKLSHLFLNLSKEPPFLYTTAEKDGQSLVIHAYNPLEKEKEFSGYLTSTLSLQRGHIALITKGRSGQDSINDLFFKNITDVAFLFFDEEICQWVKEWKEDKQPPSMIRIVYRKGEDLEDLAFFPQGDIGPIIYPKGKD